MPQSHRKWSSQERYDKADVTALPDEVVPSLLRAPGVEQLFPSQSVRILLCFLDPAKVIPSGLCSGKNVIAHSTTNLTQEVYWEGSIQESGCLG